MNETVRWKGRKCDGFTMVEVILVLMLIGILLPMVSGILTSGLRMHQKMVSVTQAPVIADTILERISDEIARAVLPVDGAAGYSVLLADDEESEWIAFESRKEGPAALFLSEGIVRMRHFEEAEDVSLFAKDFYMGYQVGTLTFSREDPKAHPGVIRAALTIKNSRTGVRHTAFRYAEIYSAGDPESGCYVRSDGTGLLPETADEFWIPEGGDIPLINDY